VPPTIIRVADAATAIAEIRRLGRTVVTFTGFSGGGYQQRPAVDRVIESILVTLDPGSVLVCSGATSQGIGTVYRIAKQRQRPFETLGIVSSIAEKESAEFSAYVDTIYVVADETWGGVDDSGHLSPASAAIVGATDRIVSIGGGAIARDEISVAMALGKPVTFIPAEMNHSAALERARDKKLPTPTDFRGSVHTLFDHE
jgi:hypothetical protein